MSECGHNAVWGGKNENDLLAIESVCDLMLNFA